MVSAWVGLFRIGQQKGQLIRAQVPGVGQILGQGVDQVPTIPTFGQLGDRAADLGVCAARQRATWHFAAAIEHLAV